MVVRIDKILWTIEGVGRYRTIQALCPIHKLRLHLDDNPFIFRSLICEDCGKSYEIPRDLGQEERYIFDRIDAKSFKALPVLNLDDEAIPLAEAKTSSKDGKFFVTANLNESKTGVRLVVYAGEKGKSNKTQIFVEPEIKRLSFDQKDLHPTDVFTKLEATFPDGTKAKMEKDKL